MAGSVLLLTQHDTEHHPEVAVQKIANFLQARPSKLAPECWQVAGGLPFSIRREVVHQVATAIDRAKLLEDGESAGSRRKVPEELDPLQRKRLDWLFVEKLRDLDNIMPEFRVF